MTGFMGSLRVTSVERIPGHNDSSSTRRVTAESTLSSAAKVTWETPWPPKVGMMVRVAIEVVERSAPPTC